MADALTTRSSLLLRLADARDERAWGQFVDLYAPLVYGFVRKHGLQDADAADVTQDVLRAVAVAIPRLEYDRARGSFRGWLFTIVRNKLRNFLGSPRQRERGTGDTTAQALLQMHPAPEEDQAALWEQEHRRHLFACAAEVVREQVQTTAWLAFWRTAVEGQDISSAARQLGITVAAVYLARSRVLARLKQQVQLLEEEQS